MQKVEGSSPFIRFTKGPGNGAFCLLPETDTHRRAASGLVRFGAAAAPPARSSVREPLVETTCVLFA
jgi:hypothetical protein